MKIGKQVTSLELSKKLKELGIKQESYFYWWQPLEDDKHWELVVFKELPSGFQQPNESVENRRASAFTVAELGELLPHAINYAELSCHKDETKWIIHYGIREIEIVGKTEADARGKMLVYLLEKKLISEKQHRLRE